MYKYKAKVIRWVDGDTVDLQVDMGFRMYGHMRFRLLGVDTPERGQPGFVEARKFCESLYPEKSDVEIETSKPGKYGRWLVTIGDLAEKLITSGHAKKY